MTGNYSGGTERQRTVEFREMECISCEVIDEHRVELFHDDGCARLQCGVCQFDRKEPLENVLEDDGAEGIVEQTVNQIRQLPESVDEPEKWRVLVPIEDFDEVKDQLNTEYDLGTYYEGISLCYTDSYDVARIEYSADLSEHSRSLHTETERETDEPEKYEL